MKNLSLETLLIYWRHMKKHPLYLGGVLLFIPLAVITHQVLPAIFAARVLDGISSGAFNDSVIDSFGPDLLGYAITLVLGGTIIWRIGIYFVWKLEMSVHLELKRTLFNHLMGLDSDFHSNSFGGSLVSRSNKLISSYVRIIDTFIFQFLTLGVMFVSASIILLPRAPYYVLALFIMTTVVIISTFLSTKAVRIAREKEASAENREIGNLADMVTNVMAVKSYAASRYEKERFERTTEKTMRTTYDVLKVSLVREIYFGSLTTGIQVVALAAAAIAVVSFDANIATVFLIYYYTNNMTVRLWDFAQSGLKNLNRGFGDAQEATKTLLTEAAVKDPKNPTAIDPALATVDFENVDFAHEKEKLFSQFNLSMQKGEKIGLVGHSGSGKTSLTTLLLRFKDVDSGSIKVAGVDIRTIAQDELRKSISYVPQEPLLFHRSIKENIAYGNPDATQKEIEQAAIQANASEFIEKLPDGYETLVGERGVKLSGGQRQRVAIARALIKNAPILVLDEATSALDSESEGLIQSALWKLMEGRTAIVIAHRLSTIQKMDRIIVLSDGKILEDGSHAELLKKKGGHYAKLWKHQSGGFLQD